MVGLRKRGPEFLVSLRQVPKKAMAIPVLGGSGGLSKSVNDGGSWGYYMTYRGY